VWSGATLAITFAGLGAAKFLRVSEEAEREGLDEHEFSPRAARTSIESNNRVDVDAKK
jgi:ammonia channel protein AmtB